MDKNALIESANKIPQVSEKAYQEYIDKMGHLVFFMNNKMGERKDINDLVGEKNISMMKDNHANHARFISSILKNKSPEVLVDTILWVFRAYRSRGFHSNYWAAQLNNWIEVLKEELTKESFGEIYAYYEWMQINIPSFVKLSDEKLQKGNSSH